MYSTARQFATEDASNADGSESEDIRSRSQLQRSASRPVHDEFDDLLMQGGQQPQQGYSQAMRDAWILGQSGQSWGYHQVQVQGEANPNSLGAAAVSSYGKVAAYSTQPQVQPQQMIGSAGSSSLKPEIKIKRKLFIAFIFLLLIYMLLTFLFFLIFFVQPMLDNINQ